MPLIFANPAGFWALLGIPAILLLHFLQRESRRHSVSTLFLLDHLERESSQGRRFDRLRNSVPLWLQLLSVLLLAWLLAEPRWTSARSVQRVVLVLDASASMSAFREPLHEALKNEIPPLTQVVGTTEYTAIESLASGANLYRGTSFAAMMDALEGWNPTASAHSPETALRIGRGVAGSDGILVYATDHLGDPLAFGALRLAVGKPLETVGFSGLRIDREGDGGEGEETSWQVVLRNYSDSPQTRRWFLASGDRRSEARTLALAPRGSQMLKGAFPAASDRLTLALEPDAFSLDDELHLVRPEAKTLTVGRTGAANVEALVAELVASLDQVLPTPPGTVADLTFATYNPLAPAPLPAVGIVFLNQEQVPRRFFPGAIVAANHPLVADLDWQGLIARETPSIPRGEDDTVLLWQGERPLVILREDAAGRRLLFNFDVAQSNAARLPAFVVLVHRFVALVREDRVGRESRNVDLGQALSIAFLAGEDSPPIELSGPEGRLAVPFARARHLRAPDKSGFFQIAQGGVVLLEAAANFADTRESDLSDAASGSELGALPESIREKRTVSDPRWQLWTLLLLAALLGCWHFLGPPERRAGIESVG